MNTILKKYFKPTFLSLIESKEGRYYSVKAVDAVLLSYETRLLQAELDTADLELYYDKLLELHTDKITTLTSFYKDKLVEVRLINKQLVILNFISCSVALISVLHTLDII